MNKYDTLYGFNVNEIVCKDNINPMAKFCIESVDKNGNTFSKTIENVDRFLMFRTETGINICIHYESEDFIKTINMSLPHEFVDVIKYKIIFNSIFGPAVLSFETNEYPIFTRDTFKKLFTDAFKYVTVDNKFLHNSLMIFTNNNISLQINNRIIPQNQIRKMLVFSDNENFSKNPNDICKELANKMNSNTWFDSLDEGPITKVITDKKDKIIKSTENKIMQSKRDKITKNVNKTISTPTSGDVFNAVSLNVKSGSKNPMADLDKMIGLEQVKKSIKKLYFKQKFDSYLASSEDNTSLHMCFLGNPGTGKTTIARIITGVLYEMKYIKENKCVEINGLDLIGNYVGQTGIITKKIIDMSRGGVLFIDEAYAINASSNPFGTEAISVLLKEMEDNRGDVVVILAGYNGPINEFLDMNSGFRSRINRYFEFEDYGISELFLILEKELKERGYAIDEQLLPAILSDFYSASKEENFSNGRYVRNYIEKLEDKHIENIIQNYQKSEALISFEKEDKNFIRRISVSI